MKAIKEKIVSRKINWLALSVLVLMISVVFTSNIVEASIFNWFDDTKSQTEFLNNSLYRPYLKNTMEISLVSSGFGLDGLW